MWNYEGLETLGDKAFNNSMSLYLMNRFPNLLKDIKAYTLALKKYIGKESMQYFSDTVQLVNLCRSNQSRFEI